MDDYLEEEFSYHEETTCIVCGVENDWSTVCRDCADENDDYYDY